MGVSKRIVWLASYPKSGNTWFRSFLSSLLNNGNLDINNLKIDEIFSARSRFDIFTDIDSTELYDIEVKKILPDVMCCFAGLNNNGLQFVKVHDAYTLNSHQRPIIPTEPTLCALYFIRNPLDIAVSFANHSGSTIDEAITTMNDVNGVLARQKDHQNTNNLFTQLMLDWSGHVKSWTTNMPFPVLVIRYEDLLADTMSTFRKAISFMGIEKSDEEIQNAINESSFAKLKEQELANGFKEKNPRGGVFFRNGVAGNWVKELTQEQIETIIGFHCDTMKTYKYNDIDSTISSIFL